MTQRLPRQLFLDYLLKKSPPSIPSPDLSISTTRSLVDPNVKEEIREMRSHARKAFLKIAYENDQSIPATEFIRMCMRFWSHEDYPYANTAIGFARLWVSRTTIRKACVSTPSPGIGRAG